MANEIKFVFLGTSGAVPSPRRNHPAMLLSYNSENILFDCGEGTQVQFKKARISASKLSKLIISHWHGDHVLGIPGLLQTLSFGGYNKTLEVYGPSGIERNFDNVLRAFPSVVVSDLQSSLRIKVSEAKGKFIDNEEFSLSAFPLKHGISCNGYCFLEKDKIRIDKKKLAKAKIPDGPLLAKLKEGKDINYNGKKISAKSLTYLEKGRKICVVMDSIYDASTIGFVKGADLLIMESTYSDDLRELARDHRHMTAKQSAEIAKKAGVKKLVLTHISDRYDKDHKKILDEAKKVFKNTTIAKDLDVVSL